MSRLAIDLTADQSERLSAEARRLGVPPEELARAAVAEQGGGASGARDMHAL